MIKHECIEIFDKNNVSFLFPLLIINQHVFLHNIFLIHKFDVFPNFQIQKH